MIFDYKIIKEPMSKEASIYTAELMAILQALKKIEKLDDRYWTIYSDSQLALQAIKEYRPKLSIMQINTISFT